MIAVGYLGRQCQAVWTFALAADCDRPLPMMTHGMTLDDLEDTFDD